MILVCTYSHGDQLYQMDFAQMIDDHAAKVPTLPLPPFLLVEREAPEFGIKSNEEQEITLSLKA